VLEQPHDPGRGTWHQPRPPNEKGGHVHRAEAVDVFGGVDALEHRTWIDLLRHRLLRKNAVDVRPRIQRGNQLQQLGLSGAGRQVKRLGAHPGPAEGLRLPPDIQHRRRIVTDENRREARRNTVPCRQRGGLSGDLAFNLRGERFSIENAGRHAPTLRGSAAPRLWWPLWAELSSPPG